MKGRIFELISKILNFDTLNKKDDDYISIEEAKSNITTTEHNFVIDTLNKAIEDSNNSRISTIHSYCLNIIKTNSDIARIDTKLDMITDEEKSKELSTIIFEVLNSDENKDKLLAISKNISLLFINGLISKYVSDTKFRTNYNSFKKDSIDTETYKKIDIRIKSITK